MLAKQPLHTTSQISILSHASKPIAIPTGGASTFTGVYQYGGDASGLGSHNISDGIANVDALVAGYLALAHDALQHAGFGFATLATGVWVMRAVFNGGNGAAALLYQID